MCSYVYVRCVCYICGYGVVFCVCTYAHTAWVRSCVRCVVGNYLHGNVSVSFVSVSCARAFVCGWTSGIHPSAAQ